MNFCPKCGAIIGIAEGVCRRCGYALEVKENQALKASNQAFEKDVLVTKLKELRELLAEAEELKSMIKPQSDFPMSECNDYKQRSFFRYFWPFLIAAPVAYYLIYILSIFITMSSFTDDGELSPYTTVDSVTGELFGGMIVGLLVAAVIIFFGIYISKRKQEDFNSNAQFMNMKENDRYQEGLKNQKVINLYQEDIQKLHMYDSLVPGEHRNVPDVNKIIELIDSDKASTVEEAISLM